MVLPLPTSNSGPGPLPIIVVVPPASAWSDCSGEPRWAWDSTAPAVTMKPAPETGEVVWPTTMSGWTPGMTSGLPALPMPTMRPSRMPMSALTMPATASMIVAFLMTMSRILSDDVQMAVDALAVAQVLAGADQQFVAVDGEVVLDLGEQLGVAEAHEVALGGAVEFGIGLPAQACHARVPSGAEIADAPWRARSAACFAPGGVERAVRRARPARARRGAPSIGTSGTALTTPGSKRTPVPGGAVDLHAPGGGAVESQRAVDLEEMRVAAHLDVAVAGVDDVDRHRRQAGEASRCRRRARGSRPARRRSSTGFSPGPIGSNSAITLVPSAKRHSM